MLKDLLRRVWHELTYDPLVDYERAKDLLARRLGLTEAEEQRRRRSRLRLVRSDRKEQSRVRTAREYVAQYTDPITVHAGARVQVGADDPEFPGWRWCTALDGRQGWVHEEFMRVEGALGTMREDYTARELSVPAGAEVMVHRVLAGWAWVSDQEGRSGWIPRACLPGDE